MPDGKGGQPFALLDSLLCGFTAGLGRFRCSLRGPGPMCRRLARRPRRLDILLLDLPLLPEPGNGIAGRLCKLGVVMEGLLVEIFDVGLFRQTFGLGQLPVGLHAVAADSAPDGPARLPLGQFLPLVSTLHAHILMLHLMDFSVGEQ